MSDPPSDCAFCAIVAGAADAHVVLDEGPTVAFLDRRPLFPGHTLLVPRTHVATLDELPPELIAPLFAQAKRLASAVERAVDAEGTFLAINNKVSQSVAHLHIHVVPRRRGDGLKGFFWPRHGYRGAAHAGQVRDALRAALADGDG